MFLVLVALAIQAHLSSCAEDWFGPLVGAHGSIKAMGLAEALEERRLSLERARGARLIQLGVSPCAVQESLLSPSQPPEDGSIRIMQYNVLAGGLSDDGFLVRPVLEDWPAGFGHVPTADGGTEQFSALIGQMLASRGNRDELESLKAKFDTPASHRNLCAVVDQDVRVMQLQLLVLAYHPHVIVLQEVDCYSKLAQDLAEFGYSSKLSCAAEEYRPAHTFGYSDRDEASAIAFRREWEARGYAFLPHLGSTSMRLRLRAAGLDQKVLDAAEAQGLKERIIDGQGQLDQNWASMVPGCSAALLEAAGLSKFSSVDDMGVAIFWRTDVITAQGIKIRTFQGGGGGIVELRLRDLLEDKPFTVMGSHLSSGDGPEDEDKRLREQIEPNEGLKAWAQDSCERGTALVLCLDANSHPQQLGSDGRSSCWRSLRSSVGASVWDCFFDANGAATLEEGTRLEPPVTSNKVRGPLSSQARKIGLHSYYLIDHVFFNPKFFSMRSHALAPRRFESAAQALQEVEPSLSNPSDHYPVIVDLAWQSHLRGASAGNGICSRFGASAMHLLRRWVRSRVCC